MIDWIRIVIELAIAVGAIGSLVYAKRTFERVRRLRIEDRESKRAFIVPSPDPGFLKYTQTLEDLECLRISLKNYGTNPASSIKGKLWGCRLAIDEGTEKMIDPIREIHRVEQRKEVQWKLKQEPTLNKNLPLFSGILKKLQNHQEPPSSNRKF